MTFARSGPYHATTSDKGSYSAVCSICPSEKKRIANRGRANGGPVRSKTVFRHLEFAPILTLASGRPLNPLVGFDANHNEAFPLSSRPLGAERNSLRSPTFANVDLRLVKYFHIKPHGKLDFVAEMFNVFNHTNISTINSVFGPTLVPAAEFGQPIEVLRPRQVQFSIDFEF